MTNSTNLNQIFTSIPEKSNSFASPRLTDIYGDFMGSYIEPANLYSVLYNRIPNFIVENEIDIKKANLWFLKKLGSEIKDTCYSKNFRESDNYKSEFSSIFYFLYEDLIVNFDLIESKAKFVFKITDVKIVKDIISSIKRMKNKNNANSSKISLLIKTNYGIESKSFQITKPLLEIQSNYNDDFQEIHHTILKRLSRKNDKGLVLLHGKAGTGKTHYIRYLLNAVSKKVIFLPPNLAEEITNPGLISILIDNPNSIFVIEDAEHILVNREQEDNSPVSGLLNITDGLLSDCLNIQIICTFNTDIRQIDNALLRKGRLIAKYEFKELETHKAQTLSNKLGFTHSVTSPMTLAAIYNPNDKEFQQSKNRNPIGFRDKS